MATKNQTTKNSKKKTKVREIPDMHFAEMFYASWYKESVSPNLSKEQKEELLKKLSNLSLERAYWTFQGENFIEKFLELKPFSSTGEISGKQLYAVQCELFNELHPSAAITPPYPELPSAAKETPTQVKPMPKEKPLLLDYSGVTGYIFHKDVIEKVGKDYINKFIDVDLEKEKSPEPPIETPHSVTIQIRYLERALRLAKKVGYNKIKLNLSAKPDEPIKLIYGNSENIEDKPTDMIQWIAPFIQS